MFKQQNLNNKASGTVPVAVPPVSKVKGITGFESEHRGQDADDSMLNIKQTVEQVLYRVLADSGLSDIEFLKTDIKNLEQNLQRIRSVLEERLPRLDGLDELHKQYAKLQGNFWDNRVESLFSGLIPIIDRVEGRLAYVFSMMRAGTNDKKLLHDVAIVLKGVKVELLSLLAAQGIQEFRTGEDRFSGRHHQAVKFVPCDDPSLEGCIARQYRAGYRHNGRIIRNELVDVYKLENGKEKI